MNHPSIAACSDRPCLEAHEGERVRLAGSFLAPSDPKRKGGHLLRLSLADATAVVLHLAVDDPLRATLLATPDGAPVALVGRIFVKDIPERYGIIQRTSDPYLVEIVESADSR